MLEDKSVEPKLSRKRGSANPYVGLEKALIYVDQLRKAVGKGPFSRDVAARGLDHTSLSGPAIGKIAALVHFSLLSRKGNAYSVTSLADRILLPVSEEDKNKAIVEAVSKPKLYKQLIDKYSGQALPLLLDNILVREYGINEKRSKAVEKTFRKSLEFVGMLNNGVISQKATSDIKSEVRAAVSPSEDIVSEMVDNTPNNTTFRPSKNITIRYPLDFTLDEAKSIKSFADYLISMRGGDQTGEK